VIWSKYFFLNLAGITMKSSCNAILLAVIFFLSSVATLCAVILPNQRCINWLDVFGDLRMPACREFNCKPVGNDLVQPCKVVGLATPTHVRGIALDYLHCTESITKASCEQLNATNICLRREYSLELSCVEVICVKNTEVLSCTP